MPTPEQLKYSQVQFQIRSCKEIALKLEKEISALPRTSHEQGNPKDELRQLASITLQRINDYQVSYEHKIRVERAQGKPGEY